MFGEHNHHFIPESFDRLRYAVSPQDAATKWAQNSAAAEPAWAAGVQNTTKDIVGRAIAQKDVAIANFTRSLNSGIWEAKLAAVGNAGIKAAAQKKSANFATGVAAAEPKMLSVMQKLLPYISAGQASIDAMPSGTIAQSKARAAAWIDYMHAGKGQF